MKNNLLKGVVGIVLILVFTILMFLGGNNQNNFEPFDPNSTNVNGTKAYSLLLQKMGYKVSTPKNYDNSGQAILTKKLTNERDGAAVLGWVKRGNTLITLNFSEDYITDKLKLRLDESANIPNVYGVTKLVYKDDQIFSGVDQLNKSMGTRFKKPFNKNVKILAEDLNGPWLLEAKWGKGKIILLSVPNLLTNDEIDKYDNVIFGINLIKRSPGILNIYFNPGFSQSDWTGPIGGRLEKHWFLSLLYIMFFILLLFYYWGKRFGRPVPAPFGLSSTGEYASSLANLYRHVKGSPLILQILSNDYRQVVTRYIGLPLYIDKEEVMVRLKGDLRPACQKAYEILRDIENTVARNDLSEGKLLNFARDMELWRRENIEDGNNLQSN